MEYFPLSFYISLLKERDLLTDCRVSRPEQTVRALTYDSRAVTPGTLFICKGARFRDEYLKSAFSAGAAAYVAEREIGGRGECLLVSDIRRAMAVLARFFYGDPQKELRTYAVTGTKGKTTVSYFLKRILDRDAAQRGEKAAGCIGSLGISDGTGEYETENTTPEAPVLWQHLRAGADAGLSRFVLEISSQALKYRRAEGLCFDVACFTNIGNDHIGSAEHPDFADYFASKLKIFDMCRAAVVNADDPRADEMLQKIGGRVPTVTYGEDAGADVRLSDVRPEDGGVCFSLTAEGKTLPFCLPMSGLFNAGNAAAAVAMAMFAGVPAETCRDALKEARVPGRMLSFATADGKNVIIVDYAHNELSFHALLSSLKKEYPDSAYVTVSGFTGGKGQNRRRDLGLLLAREASFSVITEKDSGEERFADIAAEAASYMASLGGKYAVKRDREGALRLALSLDFSGRRKVIVFAGRGTEEMQKWGETLYRYPSDAEIARKLTEEYNAAHCCGKDK